MMFKRQVILLMLVLSVSVFYLEIIYLPHLLPFVFYNYDLKSFPLEMRNIATGRVLNVGGAAVFCLMVLSGYSFTQLLESLKGDSDRLGCIGDYGEVKENEH